MPDVPDIKRWIEAAKQRADLEFGEYSPVAKRLERWLADEKAAEEAFERGFIRFLALACIAFFAVAQAFAWCEIQSFVSTGAGGEVIVFGAVVIVVVSPLIIAHVWAQVFNGNGG